MRVKRDPICKLLRSVRGSQSWRSWSALAPANTKIHDAQCYGLQCLLRISTRPQLIRSFGHLLWNAPPSPRSTHACPFWRGTNTSSCARDSSEAASEDHVLSKFSIEMSPPRAAGSCRFLERSCRPVIIEKCNALRLATYCF